MQVGLPWRIPLHPVIPPPETCARIAAQSGIARICRTRPQQPSAIGCRHVPVSTVAWPRTGLATLRTTRGIWPAPLSDSAVVAIYSRTAIGLGLRHIRQGLPHRACTRTAIAKTVSQPLLPPSYRGS